MIFGKIYECKNCGCELSENEIRNNKCPRCHMKLRYERVGTSIKEELD